MKARDLDKKFDAGEDVIEHLDPDLTLRGLAEIYRRNRARRG